MKLWKKKKCGYNKKVARRREMEGRIDREQMTLEAVKLFCVTL
jgi:hypothetical protein